MYNSLVSCDRCPATQHTHEGTFPPGWAEIKVRPPKKHRDPADRKRDDATWKRIHLCPECIKDLADFLDELRAEESERKNTNGKQVETGA